MSRRYFCKFCVLFLSLFTLSTIYSQNLQIISDSLLTELKDKGFVSCSEVKNYDFSFKYCPNTAICKKTINSWTKNEKPVFMMEAKKLNVQQMKDANYKHFKILTSQNKSIIAFSSEKHVDCLKSSIKKHIILDLENTRLLEHLLKLLQELHPCQVLLLH